MRFSNSEHTDCSPPISAGAIPAGITLSFITQRPVCVPCARMESAERLMWAHRAVLSIVAYRGETTFVAGLLIGSPAHPPRLLAASLPPSAHVWNCILLLHLSTFIFLLSCFSQPPPSIFSTAWSFPSWYPEPLPCILAFISPFFYTHTHTHTSAFSGCCCCYATLLPSVSMWSLRNISYSSGILMSSRTEATKGQGITRGGEQSHAVWAHVHQGWNTDWGKCSHLATKFIIVYLWCRCVSLREGQIKSPHH